MAFPEEVASKNAELREYVTKVRSLKTAEVETLERVEGLKGEIAALQSQNSLSVADNARLKVCRLVDFDFILHCNDGFFLDIP